MAIDSISGLYKFETFLKESMRYLEEYEGNYVLVLRDVSNFKYINKFYGREVGDDFIRSMTAKFYHRNHQCLYATRVDADQFAALYDIENMDETEELALLTEQNEEFEQEMNHGFADVFIHIYMGIYFLKDRTEDIRAAYDKAKMAKTRIKGRFDIKYQVYDPRDYEILDNIMESSGLFQRANVMNRIVPFLQPKFSVSQNRIVGAEALARIVEGDGSIVPPGRFVHALEQTGMIGVLGQIMINQIFEMQRRWLDEGRELVPVSVNISRFEYIKPGFARTMMQLQKRYDIPPQYVEFEILESLFVENGDLIIETTNALRDYGFRVSVDDFGSGYSSLNQIANMPADAVKMDGIFARQSLETEKGRIVVRMLLELLRAIDYDIIFEGVETKEQLDLIVEYGCDIIQGYYFSRPIPVEEFEEKYL